MDSEKHKEPMGALEKTKHTPFRNRTNSMPEIQLRPNKPARAKKGLSREASLPVVRFSTWPSSSISRRKVGGTSLKLSLPKAQESRSEPPSPGLQKKDSISSIVSDARATTRTPKLSVHLEESELSSEFEEEYEKLTWSWMIQNKTITIRTQEDVRNMEDVLGCITFVDVAIDYGIDFYSSALARHASAFLKTVARDREDDDRIRIYDIDEIAGIVGAITDSSDEDESSDSDDESESKADPTCEVKVCVEFLERRDYEVVVALLLETGLGLDSSMPLFDFLGEIFTCNRCEKADSKKLHSWKSLVRHFLNEYDMCEKTGSPDLWGGFLPYWNSHDVRTPSPLINYSPTELDLRLH